MALPMYFSTRAAVVDENRNTLLVSSGTDYRPMELAPNKTNQRARGHEGQSIR